MSDVATHIARLRLYRLAIPMRQRFQHAAAGRDVAEQLLVAVVLGNGVVGYGETLPRPYVTGETIESAIAAIRSVLIERLLPIRPRRFTDVLEHVDSFDFTDAQGSRIHAARAAVELAVLDAYGHHFGRELGDVIGWLGLVDYGPPGSLRRVRYSGVVSAGEPTAIKRSIRLMRWLGLRDFKIKLGIGDDVASVEAACHALGAKLRRGKCTLRADVNGAWDLEQAVETCGRLERFPLAWIEQPLAAGAIEETADLRRRTSLAICVDESLVDAEQARYLIECNACDAFNIRISKNGGFLPALRLAEMARSAGLDYQLGCLVGETSILSAAGRAFLATVPGTRFAEGSYGRWLLRGDVTDHPVRFRWGGKAPALPGPGLGVRVEPRLLEQFSTAPPVDIPL